MNSTQKPYPLKLHFGNEEGRHEINADTLAVFIDSYKTIHRQCGFALDVHLGVPEKGSWQDVLYATVTLIGIDAISALTTGTTITEWAKYGHQEIRKFTTQKAQDAPDNLPKECIVAKNALYEQLIKDRCIQSFTLDDQPTIPRQRFSAYLQKLPEEYSYYLGETSIGVHSPDWKGKRTWRSNIAMLNHKETAFDFDKDLTGRFWESIKLDTLSLHTTTDVMRVQLTERPDKKIKYWVVRVLDYNGMFIDEPLSETMIARIATLSTQRQSPKPTDDQFPFTFPD